MSNSISNPVLQKKVISRVEQAHNYALEMLKRGDATHKIPFEAWSLVDAMEAEGVKRGHILKGATTVGGNPVEEVILGVQNSELVEWQPDWGQSPEWAEFWAMDMDGTCNWYGVCGVPILDRSQWIFSSGGGNFKEAPSFGFKGTWRVSLHKRPSEEVI